MARGTPSEGGWGLYKTQTSEWRGLQSALKFGRHKTVLKKTPRLMKHKEVRIKCIWPDVSVGVWVLYYTKGYN